MKVLVGIQARTNSTRLPGKIYMPLGEEGSVLEYVYGACRRSGLDTKVLGHIADERLERFLIDKGMHYHMCTVDEDDCLGRYACGIKTYDAIIRVTADCPLVSPGLIKNCAEGLDKYDYMSNKICDVFLDGEDVQGIRAGCLRWYYDDVGPQEHAFQLIDRNHLYRGKMDLEGFKIGSIVPGENRILNPHADENKVSIDTQEDYERVRDVIRQIESSTGARADWNKQQATRSIH